MAPKSSPGRPWDPLGTPGNWHLFWIAFWIDFDNFLTDFGVPGGTKFLNFLDIFFNGFSIPHPQPTLGGLGTILASFWKPIQGHFRDCQEQPKINDFAAIYYTLATFKGPETAQKRHFFQDLFWIGSQTSNFLIWTPFWPRFGSHMGLPGRSFWNHFFHHFLGYLFTTVLCQKWASREDFHGGRGFL